MIATDTIMTQENIAPEYSVEVDLPSLGRAGKFFKLAANEDECSRIAARLGIIKVEKLEGEMRLSATKTDIKANGVVEASLIRECVSSLEPMPEQIDENFQISFSRQPPSQIDRTRHRLGSQLPVVVAAEEVERNRCHHHTRQ